MQLKITENHQLFGLLIEISSIRVKGKFQKTTIVGFRWAYEQKELLKSWLYDYAKSRDLACGWHIVDKYWYIQLPVIDKERRHLFQSFFDSELCKNITFLPIERKQHFKSIDKLLSECLPPEEKQTQNIFTEAEDLVEISTEDEKLYSTHLPKATGDEDIIAWQWQATTKLTRQRICVYPNKPNWTPLFNEDSEEPRQVLINNKLWWAIPWLDPHDRWAMPFWEDSPEKAIEEIRNVEDIQLAGNIKKEVKVIEAQLKIFLIKYEDGIKIGYKIKKGASKFHQILNYIKGSFSNRKFNRETSTWEVPPSQLEEIVDVATRITFGTTKDSWTDCLELVNQIEPKIYEHNAFDSVQMSQGFIEWCKLAIEQKLSNF